MAQVQSQSFLSELLLSTQISLPEENSPLRITSFLNTNPGIFYLVFQFPISLPISYFSRYPLSRHSRPFKQAAYKGFLPYPFSLSNPPRPLLSSPCPLPAAGVL